MTSLANVYFTLQKQSLVRTPSKLNFRPYKLVRCVKHERIACANWLWRKKFILLSTVTFQWLHTMIYMLILNCQSWVWGCVKMTKVYMSKEFCGGAKLEFSAALFRYLMTQFNNLLEGTISPLLSRWDTSKLNWVIISQLTFLKNTFLSPELYQMNWRHATYCYINIFVSPWHVFLVNQENH